jgi:hypothetical protein
MSEYQDLQKRVQSSIDAMVGRVNKDRVRPLQKQTYLNMARCFDSTDASDQVIDNCMKREAHVVEIAQQIMQQEVGQFSNRIQRCVHECEDTARDAFSSQDVSDPRVQEKAQKMMLKCSSACADKHIAMLKSIQGRLESDIDSKCKR